MGCVSIGTSQVAVDTHSYYAVTGVSMPFQSSFCFSFGQDSSRPDCLPKGQSDRTCWDPLVLEGISSKWSCSWTKKFGGIATKLCTPMFEIFRFCLMILMFRQRNPKAQWRLQPDSAAQSAPADPKAVEAENIFPPARANKCLKPQR